MQRVPPSPTPLVPLLPGVLVGCTKPGPPVAVAPPGPFLLDPNPAVTRAGLVEELARPLAAWKIDERIAFLCTDTAVRTPFALTERASFLGEVVNGQQKIVETLPKRGYRFIAPVEKLGPAEAAELEGIVEIATGEPPDHRRTGRKPAPLRWTAIAAAVILCIAAYLYFHRGPKLTDKDTIVLSDFVNRTGDPVFDRTLRQGLAIQLEQSPFLKIMDDEQVQQDLRLMSLPAGSQLTNQIAHDICVRDGSAATIDGSIASMGRAYVITLEANTCQSGQTLAREQIQAQDKEHVLNAVGTAATVKAMYPQEVRALGADIALCNTYHLMLRPGAGQAGRIAQLDPEVESSTGTGDYWFARSTPELHCGLRGDRPGPISFRGPFIRARHRAGSEFRHGLRLPG